MKLLMYVILFLAIAGVPLSASAKTEINCGKSKCEKNVSIKKWSTETIEGRCYKDGEYDRRPTDVKCKSNNSMVTCRSPKKKSEYYKCNCQNDDAFTNHSAEIKVWCPY